MSQTKTNLVTFTCLLILLFPIAAIEFPPLVDYPNHLARLAILTRSDDAFLEAAYRVEWSLLPNLGFDLIGYALAQAVSVYQAGRLFLALVVTVLLGGMMALHYALYGKVSILPLAGGPLIYSLPLQMGFLSFMLGVGLAILSFAIWIACRNLSPVKRFIILQVLTLVLFICHLISVGLLAIFVCLSAASTGWSRAGSGATMRAGAALWSMAKVVPAFVLPAVLLVSSETVGAGDGFVFVTFEAKFIMLLAALAIDRALPTVVLSILALMPLAIARTSGVRVLHPAVIWPVVFLLILYWPMPNRVLSSWLVDWRLLLPAALVAIAAAETPALGRRGCALATMLVLALNAGASANAWTHWRDGGQIFNEAKSVLRKLPQGAVLIPYMPGLIFDVEIRPPSMLHIATLAVIERSALVPTVFSFEGQQQITIRDPRFADHDWTYWMQLQMREQPEPNWLFEANIFVLAIVSDRTERTSANTLPFPASTIAQSQHFTLYQLRQQAR